MQKLQQLAHMKRELKVYIYLYMHKYVHTGVFDYYRFIGLKCHHYALFVCIAYK